MTVKRSWTWISNHSIHRSQSMISILRTKNRQMMKLIDPKHQMSNTCKTKLPRWIARTTVVMAWSSFKTSILSRGQTQRKVAIKTPLITLAWEWIQSMPRNRIILNLDMEMSLGQIQSPFHLELLVHQRELKTLFLKLKMSPLLRM